MNKANAKSEIQFESHFEKTAAYAKQLVSTQKRDAVASPSSSELNDSAKRIYGDTSVFYQGPIDHHSIPEALSNRKGGRFKPDVSSKSSILVHSGKSSNGLCALVIDFQNEVDQFCHSNPVALKTLMTRALSGQLIFWFRCDDWMPPDAAAGNMLWCSGGLVPIGWVGETLESRVIKNLPVAQVEFGKLQWDGYAARVFAISKMMDQFGPALRCKGNRLILNDSLICRVFAQDCGVYFDSTAKRFLRKSSSGELECFYDEDLLDFLEAWLRGIAPLFKVQFPMEELRLPRLMTLIRRIKTFAALSPPDQFEGLLHFLKARVCFKRGSSLTTEELYKEYTKPLDINRYPRCRFERFLPSAISQTFETVPAHNISRWNEEQKKMTSRRGFNGLAFRNETNASDGMDASDVCLEKSANRVSN